MHVLHRLPFQGFTLLALMCSMPNLWLSFPNCFYCCIELHTFLLNVHCVECYIFSYIPVADSNGLQWHCKLATGLCLSGLCVSLVNIIYIVRLFPPDHLLISAMLRLMIKYTVFVVLLCAIVACFVR